MNKKFWYYFLHWTWALPINIVGAIIFGVCKLFKCPSHKYRNGFYVEVPWAFGGLEAGMFFVIGKGCESCIPHEYGHSIQMLWWGMLFAPIIGGPSCARYWLREFKPKRMLLFPFILLLAGFVLLLSTGIITILTNIAWPLIIGAIIFFYLAGLFIWLVLFEIPKYENNQKVPYDSIWFEGQATKLGKRAEKNEWNWL